MFTHRLKSIRDRVAVTDFGKPLTINERRIVREGFVESSHLIAISVAADLGRFAVTFRDAGIDTIDWLKMGAATKPHSILEKTLKTSRLKDMRIAASVLRHGLKGLTAHWDESGALIGIFITSEAAALLKRSFKKIIVEQDGQKNYWIPINFERVTDLNLQAFKQIRGWQTMVIAGDYDLHDMISFEGKPHTPPSESKEEEFIRLAINTAVSAIQNGRESIAHRVVQHGPQVSYPAFIAAKERSQFHSLVKAVAEPSLVPRDQWDAKSPSLALCDRGEWRLLETLEELEKYYKDCGAVLKTTWTPGTDHLHFATTKSGKVSLAKPELKPR